MCRCVPTASRERSRPFRCLLLGVLALSVLLIAAAVHYGQEPPPAALKPGDDLPGTFHPWAFTGKHVETLRRRILATIRDNDDALLKEEKKKRAAAITGAFHCPVSEQGLNPVVLIFVKGTNPSATLLQFLQKLDEAVVKHERERLAVAVVFLDENIKDVVKDDDPRTTAATALEPKLNPMTSITAGVDSFDALKDLYKLSPDSDITLVMYNKLKVVSVKALLNATFDDKAAEDELKDIETKLKGAPPTPAAPPKDKDRPPLGEKQ
jgi:hypothetical protein